MRLKKDITNSFECSADGYPGVVFVVTYAARVESAAVQYGRGFSLDVNAKLECTDHEINRIDVVVGADADDSLPLDLDVLGRRFRALFGEAVKRDAVSEAERSDDWSEVMS